MSQATTADRDEPPPFDVNKSVIRRLANSDRESAWVYQSFLDFFYEDDNP